MHIEYPAELTGMIVENVMCCQHLLLHIEKPLAACWLWHLIYLIKFGLIEPNTIL